VGNLTAPVGSPAGAVGFPGFVPLPPVPPPAAYRRPAPRRPAGPRPPLPPVAHTAPATAELSTAARRAVPAAGHVRSRRRARRSWRSALGSLLVFTVLYPAVGLMMVALLLHLV
jgi:hypothetical protein